MVLPTRYVLHVRNYVLKKVLLLVMWFTQKYICSIRSKVENHKPVKKLHTLLIQFILLIKCFKYLDPSRQYLNCEPYGIQTVPPNLRIYTPQKIIKVKSSLEFAHSVLERIWVKGSYLSQWLPQGERGPPKESKSRWIEILHGGSQIT